MPALNDIGTIVRGSHPPLEEEVDTWERESPPIYDEPSLAPNSGPKLRASSSIQNSGHDESPPLISEDRESAKKATEPQKRNIGVEQGLSSSTPGAAAPVTWSKTVSSLGSRMVAIFGIISFAAGVGLGAILVSKSGWSSHARPSYESIAEANLAATKATSVAAAAPDSNLSEAVDQLKSVGTELTSLRQEIRSLAGELAQVRQAQQDLMATQARKSERPESRAPSRRSSRGKAVTAPVPAPVPD